LVEQEGDEQILAQLAGQHQMASIPENRHIYDRLEKLFK
jgi:hypothetical protein